MTSSATPEAAPIRIYVKQTEIHFGKRSSILTRCSAIPKGLPSEFENWCLSSNVRCTTDTAEAVRRSDVRSSALLAALFSDCVNRHSLIGSPLTTTFTSWIASRPTRYACVSNSRCKSPRTEQGTKIRSSCFLPTPHTPHGSGPLHPPPSKNASSLLPALNQPRFKRRSVCFCCQLSNVPDLARRTIADPALSKSGITHSGLSAKKSSTA